MHTDYEATYFRDTQSIEVSDGHDNVVVEIPCAEGRIASAMRDQFGNMAAHIPVTILDTVEI